tara:strand:+ start:560 stop:2209 length:1650 start_codon:yes stop_codon:yes gene_type:complete
MASTYVNDLRLNEMATGDASGTWGTTTNTNLELIGEALGFGTEAITTNADTHTTTVADGATDPGRAMYLKYTGTLDSACTITIAPNTISRMQFIENGTSGSQNIIISQGSGANITIPPGDTKAVYLDGAGSGAAVVDAFASLSTVDLKVQDDLTVTDDASVGGDLLVSGEVQTANIGFTDGDNAITISDGGSTSFAQKITADAGIDIDNFNIDGTTIALSSGDMLFDAAADINLDAGGENIKFSLNGTEVGQIDLGSSNLTIRSQVDDKDIIFRGQDATSEIVALTLDMSAAGAATFNSNITMPSGGALLFGERGNLTHDASSYDMTFNTNGASNTLVIEGTGLVGINETDPLGKLHVKKNDSGVTAPNAAFATVVVEDNTDTGISLLSTDTGTIAFNDANGAPDGSLQYRHDDLSMRITTAGTEKLYVKGDGQVDLKGGTTTGIQVLQFTNSSVTIAADASIAVIAPNTGSLVSVLAQKSHLGNSFPSGLFYASDNSITEISDAEGCFTTTANTASRINVYMESGNLRVQNKNATCPFAMGCIDYRGV